MLLKSNESRKVMKMDLYVAPLEGITGYIFRNAYQDYFGADAKKYYSPFLSLGTKIGIKEKERRDVLPTNNKNYNLIPQVMTISPEDFNKTKQILRDFGYEEININFGCPARTVTSGGRGSGALANLSKLDQFLDEIFKDGDTNISIKTRIGIKYTEEFASILEIYNKYPIKELTIHPRLLKEQYKGVPHHEIFLEALPIAKMPVCYNGDINTVEDYVQLMKLIGENSDKNISAVMIGRGMLRDPAIIRKITAYTKNPAAYSELDMAASNKEVKDFLCRLQKDYSAIYSGQLPVLYKLKEIWCYLGRGIYAEEPKLFKKLLKSKNLAEYEIYMQQILTDK